MDKKTNTKQIGDIQIVFVGKPLKVSCSPIKTADGRIGIDEYRVKKKRKPIAD